MTLEAIHFESHRFYVADEWVMFCASKSLNKSGAVEETLVLNLMGA